MGRCIVPYDFVQPYKTATPVPLSSGFFSRESSVIVRVTARSQDRLLEKERNGLMALETPEHLHRSFVAAFNRSDLDALLALYEPEAALLPQPNAVIRGREAIRESLMQFLALRGSMTMNTAFTVQSGELALLRGQWALTGTGPNGEAVSMSGKSVEVARRQPNGEWRFVIDHPFGAEP